MVNFLNLSSLSSYLNLGLGLGFVYVIAACLIIQKEKQPLPTSVLWLFTGLNIFGLMHAISGTTALWYVVGFLAGMVSAIMAMFCVKTAEQKIKNAIKSLKR